MGKSFYIISKPLQYFNAININDELVNKICLIVDNFYRAEAFFNNIRNDKFWNTVLFFDNAFDAYKWLKVNVNLEDYLFIDSDYGARKTIWLSQIKSCNIYVYEEGIGSYRVDLLKEGPRAKWFKLLLKFCGIEEYMGGGPFTKGIIIYDIERHKKLVNNYRKVRLQFKSSFLNHLLSDDVSRSFNFGDSIFNSGGLNGKKIFIYLTDFEYNVKADLLCFQYSDYFKILKPHPNNKNSFTNDQYSIILDNSILIELFIIKVVSIASDLIVVHENSSVEHYLREVNGITFINLKC